MRRGLIAAISLTCVIVIIVIAVVARNRQQALAQLRVRDPVVSVQPNGDASRAGEEGENLAPGEIVRTDPSGQARIDFFDGSTTRLDSDTEVAVLDLADRSRARTISFAVHSGRTWNRVADLTSQLDRFTVRMANATAIVRGTTFIVDCRAAPTCYVIGINDEVEVRSTKGETRSVKAGGCVAATTEGLVRCNAKGLGLLDAWVTDNLAEDQQLDLNSIGSKTPKLTPSPSPTPVRTFRHFTPAPAPAPTTTPTATPTPTPAKSATPKPSKSPTPTSSPAPTVVLPSPRSS